MKNKFLTVFISVFLAIVLGLSAVLGIISLIKEAKATVKYGDVSMDKGTVTYLAAYYKSIYIRSLLVSGIDASDTEEFWQSEKEAGVSYGDDFMDSLSQYIASLAVAADLYLENASYTAEDKLCVSLSCEDILLAYTDGSISNFNEEAEIFGFDFNDFKNAAAILYKAERASSVIYGYSGENIASRPELCEEYLKEYSHVYLLFYNTTEDMTDSDRAAKEAKIAELTDAINAKNNGENMQINPDVFMSNLAQSDGDEAMNEIGYYFHPSSAKTVEFATAFPEVVEASLKMNEEEFLRVDCSIGTCFIYKTAPTPGAYSDNTNIFFSDFYANASAYHFTSVLTQLIEDVTFKDKYFELDLLSVPTINDFYIRQWKN